MFHSDPGQWMGGPILFWTLTLADHLYCSRSLATSYLPLHVSAYACIRLLHSFRFARNTGATSLSYETSIPVSARMTPSGRRRMDAGRRSQSTRTTVAATKHLILPYILGFAMLSQRATGLQYVPGSKCASVCGDSAAGTLEDDVVCLDAQYGTRPGSFLRDCISCELNSTAVDSTNNITDVQWGLCKYCGLVPVSIS